jgi:hypothetical protein
MVLRWSTLKIMSCDPDLHPRWPSSADIVLTHKSGRGPSNEHFWQIWFKSVQWFQRRVKYEKLTDEQSFNIGPYGKNV